MLISRLDSGDVDLLPLNGYIIRLEYCLDGFGNLSTDTVACNYKSAASTSEGGMRLNCSPGMSVDVYLPPNLVG